MKPSSLNLLVGMLFSCSAIQTHSEESMSATPLPPSAETLSPLNITATTASLQGTVNPNGAETTAHFEYGLTTDYGNVTVATNVGGGISALPVQAAIDGLSPNTVYHYRVVAGNEMGTNAGVDLTFLTKVFAHAPASLPGITRGAAVWGDYDNDGDLDVLLTGDTQTEAGDISHVYRNDGDGTFTDINIGLPGIDYSFAVWGDYDNDGDLDILLTGGATYASMITQVWRNTGDGFTNISAKLPGLLARVSPAAWGDYDNDGDLDILLAGAGVSGDITKIYENQGGTNFEELASVNLPGVRLGSVAWGDYDNDGLLDFVLTGQASSNKIAQIWRNTGNGFTNINAGLPGVSYSMVAWGDYDQDGRLDILLAGVTYQLNQDPITQVWRNTGDGFTNIEANLTSVWSGSACWADYDNDGCLDILLTGFTAGGRTAEIYRNTGSGFTNIGADLPGTCCTSSAWGDFDNDGDLDLLLVGSSYSGLISWLYENHIGSSNTPPTAPSDLVALVTGNGVRLNWDAAADAQTPSPGLTYNLRVGTMPGGMDLVSPQADPPTGFRRVPQMGNQGHRLFGYLTNLEAGTYYWSVQAFDTAFAGSPFAEEVSFAVVTPKFLKITPQPGFMFLIECQGAPGTNYTLQLSTNMEEWVDRTNLVANANGLFRVIQAPPQEASASFYRLRWQ